jgi:glycolate oxidase iron-sulfur subunit
MDDMFDNLRQSHLSAKKAPSPTSKQAVSDAIDYELLFDCVHCGLCLESCPTYVTTRAEMDSPRGRIYLMKGLAEGRVDLDRDVVRHLDLCLECRACETACPSGVRYGRLIESARSYVEQHWHRGLFERLRNGLIGAVFPYPRRLRAALAPLRVAERIGARGILRALLPSSARDWLDLVPIMKGQHDAISSNRDVSPNFFREPDGEPRTTGCKVAIHTGCVTQVLTPSTNANSELLLATAGYQVIPLRETVCCGALDIHHGNFVRARRFARANVAAIASSGADSIISAASGCSAVIAQYGELLKNDPEFCTAAREVAARVADLSSLLLAARAGSHITLHSPGNKRTSDSPSRGTQKCDSSPSLSARSKLATAGKGEPRNVGPGAAEQSAIRVTYHDSCHLLHGLGVREAPRELLRSIPGVRLVELFEADLCCGSAGSYNLTERAMARALVQRKADNIVATGAEYVVLSNPGCQLQIAAELNRRKAPVRVMHLADFLALTLRRYSTAGQPESI